MKKKLSDLSVLTEPVGIMAYMNPCIRLCNDVILQLREENAKLKRELNHTQENKCACMYIIYRIARKFGEEFKFGRLASTDMNLKLAN